MKRSSKRQSPPYFCTKAERLDTHQFRATVGAVEWHAYPDTQSFEISLFSCPEMVKSFRSGFLRSRLKTSILYLRKIITSDKKDVGYFLDFLDIDSHFMAPTEGIDDVMIGMAQVEAEVCWAPGRSIGKERFAICAGF